MNKVSRDNPTISQSRAVALSLIKRVQGQRIRFEPEAPGMTGTESHAICILSLTGVLFRRLVGLGLNRSHSGRM